MPIKKVDPVSGAIIYKRTAREKKAAEAIRAVPKIQTNLAGLKSQVSGDVQEMAALKVELEGIKAILAAILTSGLTEKSKAKIAAEVGQETLDKYLSK